MPYQPGHRCLCCSLRYVKISLIFELFSQFAFQRVFLIVQPVLTLSVMRGALKGELLVVLVRVVTEVHPREVRVVTEVPLRVVRVVTEEEHLAQVFFFL
jgi:hypothetical protein